MDLIDRQAAIDALKEKVFHNLSDEFFGAMQVLSELPSAQSNKQWISVTEPPKNSRQVLVYAMSTHYSIAQYKSIRKGVNDYQMMWVTSDAFNVPYEIKNVLAWCELSEYRAEKGDE